jgi:hypothetical protein
MGGYGSGRTGGRPTVESALRLDIDTLIRRGVIQPGARVRCEMQFSFYEDELDVRCEAHVGDPWNSFVRLQWSIIGPARNSRLMTRSASPRRGRSSEAYGGGSCARA